MSPNVGTAEIAAMKVHAIASYAGTLEKISRKKPTIRPAC
jgi:hypothetical protein